MGGNTIRIVNYASCQLIADRKAKFYKPLQVIDSIKKVKHELNFKIKFNYNKHFSNSLTYNPLKSRFFLGN